MSISDETSLKNASDDNFFVSSTVRMLTATTASISAISSVLVILFIVRSTSKLSSPYHCIMFFMSSWDIVLSVTIALTTMPMPSNDDERFYSYDGESRGSISTCTLQGFLYLVCSGLCVCANTSLCVFYVCTICYGMKEKTVKKVLLPTLFSISMISSLCCPIFMLFSDLFNPSPMDPFCSYGTLPYDCNSRLDEEYAKCDPSSDDRLCEAEEDVIVCIRGDPFFYHITMILIALFFVLHFIIIMVSMTLIVLKVYREDETTGSLEDEQQSEASMLDDSSESCPTDVCGGGEGIAVFGDTKKLRKKVILQAIMYIGAYLLTWTFSTLSLFLYMRNDGSVASFTSIAFLRLFFQPLQGFFNAIIFFFHKVHNVHQSDDDISWGEAVRTTVFSPSEVPEILISDIEIVIVDSYMTQRKLVIAAMDKLPVDAMSLSGRSRGQRSSDALDGASCESLANSSLSSSIGLSEDRKSGTWSLTGETGGLSVASSHMIVSLTMIKEGPDECEISL